jgi:hypothetical protein
MCKYLVVLLMYSVVFTFKSCTIPMYGIGKIGSENNYLAKPTYNESVEKNNAFYVHAVGNVSLNDAVYRKGEKLYYGETMLYRSHTYKYLQLSYGAFGYLGNYYISSEGLYNGNHNLYGGGFTFHSNLLYAVDFVEFRYVGIRITGLYENGKFADFRNEAQKDFLIYNIHPNNRAFNVSATSEVNYNFNKLNFGCYFSFGSTFDIDNLILLTYSAALQASYGSYTGFLQFNKSLIYFIPFLAYEGSNLSNLSIGCSYRIGKSAKK